MIMKMMMMIMMMTMMIIIIIVMRGSQKFLSLAILSYIFGQEKCYLHQPLALTSVL